MNIDLDLENKTVRIDDVRYRLVELTFEPGDKVRAITGACYGDSFTSTFSPGSTGEVLNVDTGDDTVYVKLDGVNRPHWFHFGQVEVVK